MSDQKTKQEEIYYNREKLYKEIWEEPITIVSKRYGVSDVTLAKTCKKLNVPHPSVGYWTKKKYGKKVHHPKLPKFNNPPKILLSKYRVKYWKPVKKEPVLAPEAFEEAERLIDRESNPDMKIIVPKEISKLHQFIVNTRNYFKNFKRPYWGYEYGRITSSGIDIFPLNISPDSLDRVTLILQSLCDAFVKRGFTLSNDEDRNHACVMIMGEKVSFTIFESSHKVSVSEEEAEKTYRNYKYETTGILRIEIIGISRDKLQRKSWSDTKSAPLEEKLGEFVIGLIKASAWEKEYQVYWKKREKEIEIERQKQREITRLNRIEEIRISNFEKGYQKWLYHKQLSEYVAEVKSKYLNMQGEIEQDEDFSKWIDWAEKYLIKLDPLKNEFPKYDITKDRPWL